MKRRILGLCVLSFLLLNLTACSLPGKKSQPVVANSNNTQQPIAQQATTTTGINKFSSLEELKNFLLKNQQTGYVGGRGGAMQTDSLAAPMAKSVASPAGLGSGPVMTSESATGQAASYSKTNNQVAGVDEADIVKTDGKYLYIVSGDKLRIVSAEPADAVKLIKEITLDGPAGQLFIKDNKLAVFGQANQFEPATDKQTSGTTSEAAVAPSAKLGAVGKMIAPGILPPRFYSEFAFFKVYDLSDIANPKLIRDLHFDGSYFDARLIGDNIFFITTKYSYQLLDKPLPRIFSGQTEIGLAMPPVYYFNLPYDSYNFTTVSSISLSDDQLEPQREVYMLAGQENLYVSEKNIYMTYSKYLDEQELISKKTRELLWSKLTESEQARITKIEAIDEDILNKWEKQQKINQVLDNYTAKLSDTERQVLDTQIKDGIKAEHPNLVDELQTTVIHKINIENGKLAYQGEASVPGQVLNQFSMDEASSSFRIAVTRGQTWSSILGEQNLKPASAVYVLDENLNVVGQLAGLAEGEQIYSARFMGERLYLVTFKRTDPLFVIDLADPKAPKVLGKMELPGYSNYLHPVGKDLLLGLGKDVKTTQWGDIPASLKLGLFDVSDTANPKELSSYTIGAQGSDSAALYDHKAFLYDQEKNILVIPATLTDRIDNESGWGKVSFNGALVFTLKDQKIELLGKISHWANFDPNSFDYQKAIRRALIINSNLYTVSDETLKVNELPNLKSIGNLGFVNTQVDNIKPLIEEVPTTMPGTGAGISPQVKALK